MIRYTLLIAFFATCLTACSDKPEDIEETPEAIEAALEKMEEEIKTTAEEMTEEAPSEPVIAEE